jgi:hypothetical protein
MGKFDFERRRKERRESETEKLQQETEFEKELCQEADELAADINGFTGQNGIDIEMVLSANIVSLTQGKRTFVITVNGGDKYTIKRGGGPLFQVDDLNSLMDNILNWLESA